MKTRQRCYQGRCERAYLCNQALTLALVSLLLTPQGSFSFPSVPPSAALVYDVHLVEWEAPEEVRALDI